MVKKQKTKQKKSEKIKEVSKETISSKKLKSKKIKSSSKISNPSISSAGRNSDKEKNKFLMGSVLGIILTVFFYSVFSSSGIINMPNMKSGANSYESPEQACNSFLKFKEIKSSLIPSGIPDIYGEELDISFDQVQDAINKVRIFGPTYGQEGKKITLAGAELKRYIKIASQTACEFCCGVKTLVRKDGTAACGCAHSTMMRGLTAYLIKNHSNLSDERILEEVNKWKATFFPKQSISKELKKMQEAGEPGIENLLKEFPDFLPKMVGGC